MWALLQKCPPQLQFSRKHTYPQTPTLVVLLWVQQVDAMGGRELLRNSSYITAGIPMPEDCHYLPMPDRHAGPSLPPDAGGLSLPLHM